ncbi:MAG: hypothetical protein LH472_07540 [Pyrinomonadaceae bacterium]|nr:hypothetical protein [Pyrinomonadaceae bacterium]
MNKKIIYTTILTAFAAVGIFAQQTPAPPPTPQNYPQPAPTPINLEKVLDEAERQIVVYQETFRDLLATETKTFEEFDKNGELDGETIIESIFLVYQSAKDDKVSSELRNVVKVNNKLVPDSQARADRFLAELQKTKTLEKELEKIQNEGLRYDKTLIIVGFTLFEGIVLADNLRPVFDFKLVSTENYQGSEVFVVSYQQTKKSPFITIDEKQSKDVGVNADFDINLPGALKKNEKFLRGKLWIDAKTFQIRREERQIIVQTNAAPLVAQETVFEYVPSEFGIQVPKKITFLDNNLKKISKDDNFSAVKDTKVTFDYSKFKKTNVEVQISDDEN